MGQAVSEEQQQEDFKKRSDVVKEIVATEKTYVDNLSALQTVFRQPLEIKLKQGRGVISDSNLQDIFSNWSEIYEVHFLLLEDLNRRMSDWHKKQKIADVFLKHVSGALPPPNLDPFWLA